MPGPGSLDVPQVQFACQETVNSRACIPAARQIGLKLNAEMLVNRFLPPPSRQKRCGTVCAGVIGDSPGLCTRCSAELNGQQHWTRGFDCAFRGLRARVIGNLADSRSKREKCCCVPPCKTDGRHRIRPGGGGAVEGTGNSTGSTGGSWQARTTAAE